MKQDPKTVDVPATPPVLLDYARPAKSDRGFFITLGFLLSGVYWFLTVTNLDKPVMYVFFFPFVDLTILLHLPDDWEFFAFILNIPLWGFGPAYVITLIRRRRNRDCAQ